MKLYSQSDIGLRRNSNQDYCMTGYFPDGAAFAIVCDGMGGANGGSTASRVATETIAETINGAAQSVSNTAQGISNTSDFAEKAAKAGEQLFWLSQRMDGCMSFMPETAGHICVQMTVSDR